MSAAVQPFAGRPSRTSAGSAHKWALALVLTTASACGGSASETPPPLPPHPLHEPYRVKHGPPVSAPEPALQEEEEEDPDEAEPAVPATPQGPTSGEAAPQSAPE